MKKNDLILSAMLAAIVCLLTATVFIISSDVNIEVDGNISIEQQGKNTAVNTVVTTPTQNVTEPTTQTVPDTTLPDNSADNTQKPSDTKDETDSTSVSAPKTTQEIIDKYTLLVDKFKKEKPAYTKKEYQALPEDYRNFSSAINTVLGIAARYMVTEEESEELIRPAGAQEILNDVPIHNSEKGCTLTDYSAVEWAKCEDLGDGTYKLSFSLKEEYNAEPTPADTLVPPSAHGAVMQPMAISDIVAEVDKVVSSLPGISLNQFDLIYRDCVFSCVYKPETDEVLSITHNIAIDINADVKVFSADIVGSARLINDMLIYDITW